MYYHIILTTKCNSKCKYCYEKSMNDFEANIKKNYNVDLSPPETSEINILDLKKFISKDSNPVIVFYGGEPLLEINKIKEIMDNIEVPYRIQTNGKLLHKIPTNYLNRMDKILVSIDGNKERTDSNRGNGTYNLVTKNISTIRNRGYSGEIIARMTLSNEYSDVFEQVLHLIESGFSSIHWQIDAGFYVFDYDKEKLAIFVENYNKSITKLIELWIETMKQNEKVLKLYPFIGITESLLKQEKTILRCGAGHSGYAIRTDGKIISCPIMSWIEDFIIGDLNSNPNKIKSFQFADRCKNCNIKDICGGRCLYWNYLSLWPEEGNILICKTIEHLVIQLQDKISEISGLIEKGVISYKDFEYEKYFGPEIIP